MEEIRTRFKQEPLSPGQVNRLGHDLMAMQQTYHQGESLQRSITEGAIDMSQGMRTSTITAGMSYVPETMATYTISSQDVTPVYSMQDRSLMLGMYGYAPMIHNGKSTANMETTYVNGTESSNGRDIADEEETAMPPKIRNTALPGMGKRSHLPKRYKCAMCAYRTRYKSDLNRHVRKHAVATFNCDICNMPFKTIGNVEFHKRKEHSDMIMTTATTAPASAKDQTIHHNCKLCDYSTIYSSDLTRHMRKHYSAKYHCNLCNHPFMTSGRFVQHKRTAHDATEHEIDTTVCEEGAENANDTEESTIMDEGERDENSIEVKDTTGTAVDLVKSTKSKNVGDQSDARTTMKKIQYSTNEQASDSFQDVANGGKVVEDENKNITEHNNGVKLEEADDANAHGQLHLPKSGGKDGPTCTKYTCEYCNKSFGRKLVLEYHQKNIHKIVKLGQGSDMYVEYPDDDYDLALDMSIQELENSTSDAVVGRGTIVDGNGKLRHQCQFCAYATNYKSTFDRHVKKHDLECHICDVCRMPFITFGHLQRHIRDNHPDHVQLNSKKEGAMENKSNCQIYDYTQPDRNIQGNKQDPDVPPGGDISRRYGFERTRFALPSNCTNGVTKTHFNGSLYDVPQVKTSCVVTTTVPKPELSMNRPQNGSNDEDGVSSFPPSSGRYAKLVSDYDSFATKPFACALCFFRTNDVHVLVEHAENHLTGCNITPVPETCMFKVQPSQIEVGIDGSKQMRYPSLPVHNLSYHHPHRSISHSIWDGTTTGDKSAVIGDQGNGSFQQNVGTDDARAFSSKAAFKASSDVKVTAQSQNQIDNGVQGHKGRKPALRTQQQQQLATQCNRTASCNETETMATASVAERRNDRMIPTFSVHYRKDKTNKARPYLCLMCRKRFRHLMLLKQHFKQAHSESQMGNSRSYTCRICKEVFTNPMLLQEHHDINH